MQTTTSKKSSGHRVAAVVATIVAAASLAAGPAAAPASAAGCGAWVCGDNHNEAMATTIA